MSRRLTHYSQMEGRIDPPEYNEGRRIRAPSPPKRTERCCEMCGNPVELRGPRDDRFYWCDPCALVDGPTKMMEIDDA